MILRSLLSAALAAAVLAADLAVLVLDLNPGLELRQEARALLLAVVLPYAGTACAGYCFLALLGAGLRARPALRPPIEGLPWFLSFALLSSLLATLLFGLNLLTYRYSIPVPFVRSLAAATAALAASTLVLGAVGLDALLFPRQGRGGAAGLAVLACAANLAVPLALRPLPAPEARPLPLAIETMQPLRRVVLIGIDGLGPRQLERGLLPVLSTLVSTGRAAWGPLASFRPSEGPPVWTSLLTGRFPRDHGVKSFVTYRLAGSATRYELMPRGIFAGMLERTGLLSRLPVTSAARRRKALWNTLNAFGIGSGTLRIWGTHPAERVTGFMVSPYFHQLRRDPVRSRGLLEPAALLPQMEALAVEPEDLERSMLPQFVDTPVTISRADTQLRRELLERALAPDLTGERVGSALRAAFDPPFFASYYFGLDVVGHSFTRFAEPERFGDVRPDEVRRYGRVLERYGAQLGQIVEAAVKALRPGEVLLVVSGYGMDPQPLWRRVLASLGVGPAVSGTHAGAPDGVLLALGDGIRPGARIRNASLLDVAPTILYLMGLPVALDMEGRVLSEIVDDGFVRDHPLTFIPSYESLAVTAADGAADDALLPLPEETP